YEIVASLTDVARRLEDASCDLEPLTTALEIAVSDEPQALDADLQQAVDASWTEELRAHPNRFDGPLLSYLGRDGNRLRGRFIPYRQFLAQRRSPSLRGRLGVVPLAVTGLVVCEGHVAWARRGDAVTQYPGWWELVPSGGIDRAQLRSDGTVDHVAQLLRELHEETGIAPSLVTRTAPLALVHDRCDDVVDIATLVEVAAAARTIAEQTVARGGAEYRALRWVARGDLAAFLAAAADPIVPCSRALCRLYCERF
ncbi:MAG: hydrolase, partial [bacterium]|nr:hydrolase [bacterium]